MFFKIFIPDHIEGEARQGAGTPASSPTHKVN